MTGNLFYSDFIDAQRYIGVPLSTGDAQVYTVNAEEAYSYGVELGVSCQLFDNLGLNAGVGALKTEITKMTDNTAYEGNEFGQAPGYTVSIGASWDILCDLNPSGGVRLIDGCYSDDANTADFNIDFYTLANARLSYQLSETFGLS